jgi:hypothetical protein
MSSESEAYILLNLNVEGVLGYRLFFRGLPSPTPPHPQSLFLVGEERRMNLLLGILGVGEGMGWAEVRGIWSVCLGRCTWSLEGTKSHDRNEHLSFGKWGHKCL